MLQLPPLSSLPRRPVTVLIAAACVGMTAWWGVDNSVIGWAGEDYRIWDGGQIWRVFTSTLLHSHGLHLAFNLYWWLIFGAFVEEQLGSAWLFGISLVLAFCSSLAEFAVFSGGVGLSGVVYGLWAMLAVMERSDPRFQGAVDRKTNHLFIAWFFVCIILTLQNIMPVANVAHGMGALTGALLGLALGGAGVWKHASTAGLMLIMVVTTVAATLFWPWVNLSDYKYKVMNYSGREAIHRGDFQEAVEWLKIATRQADTDAETWYSLGYAYHALGRFEEALEAYRQAVVQPDATADMRDATQKMSEFLAKKAGP